MSENEKAQLCGFAVQRYSDIRKELAYLQEKRVQWQVRLQVICQMLKSHSRPIQTDLERLREKSPLPSREDILSLIERETTLQQELSDSLKQLTDLGISGLQSS